MEVIYPENKQIWLEERARDITSTEVPALFACSPYMTEFELWHRKKEATIVTIEENERMKWGIRLQDSIAQGIAEEQGWTIRKMEEYIRIPELKIGSSFDFSIETEDDMGILEIKNVDGLVFKQQWEEKDDGDYEAPLHIEFQVQHQLLVSDRKYAYIGVLVGGNNLYLLKRERNEKVIAAIRAASIKFWRSIQENQVPSPDFAKDSSFISSLYNYAEPGKVIDANEEIDVIANEYKEVSASIKILDNKKSELKAKLLMMIGDSEKVIGDNFSISAGLISPKMIEAYERKGYRSFRINWRKK